MINKKYKDRLFCKLFGSEEYKDNILALYNALSGTTHDKVEDIQIYTIDDVIYIKMKNDVSILVDSFLHLWEQQSTFNPNMPVRGMMYFGQMYSRYITENNLNIYGKKVVQLPTPRYTVLYNGVEDQPAFRKLKLSDAFSYPDGSGEYEWTANMINLNSGKNEQLLDACKPLKDYMTLVNKIRANSEIMKFDVAVDEAVTYCIKHDVLRTFLITHRAEVLNMCITEYNEKAFVDGIRAEGIEEGIEKGRKEGIEEGRLGEIFSSVAEGIYGVERGAERAGMSVPDFVKAMTEAKFTVPKENK